MTYILIGLCKYPHGPAVDRAWIVLNEVFFDSNKEDLADISGLTDAQKESTRNFLRQPLLRLLERAQLIRKQGLQVTSHMNYSSDAPPTLYSGCISNSLAPENNFQRPDRKDVSDDPFLGSAPDFGDGMKLDEMDSWIHRVQNDFVFQQESIDKQAKLFSMW